MTPRSLTLAAIASAAVPGVAPASVATLTSPHRRGADRYLTAVVTDRLGARWIVRLPADAVAAARQDASLPLLRLLGRRLPFEVPAPVGRMTVRDGRGAVVYPYLSGAPLDAAALPAGSQLAARVGRAVAAIHNLDRRLADETALPTYAAEDCRRRHVADLDRAAATRRVPTGLLSRWERALDDVSLWRFAPTVVHGWLDGERFLLEATDPADSETAEVVAIVGWDAAAVADPATDIAEIVRRCTPEAADTVLEAYAMARDEPVDANLLERAWLIAEFDVLASFLAAVHADDHRSMARLGAELTQLDTRVGDRDAPARADAEPLFDTVPVDFAREPVEGNLYQAGQIEPAIGVTTEPPKPDPADPPDVELDARQQRTNEDSQADLRRHR